jgi:cytochrome P450
MPRSRAATSATGAGSAPRAPVPVFAATAGGHSRRAQKSDLRYFSDFLKNGGLIGSKKQHAGAGHGVPPGPRWPRAVQTLAWWTRPIAFMESCRARFGNRVTIRPYAFPYPFVLLADPEDVREVFTAPPEVLHPGEGTRVLQPILGRNSVVLLDEDAHLEQRKLILPSFHGEKVKHFSGLIAEVAERSIATWPRGEPIDLLERFLDLGLEVMLRVVFGLEGERLEALRARMHTALDLSRKMPTMIPATQRESDGRSRWPRFDRARTTADSIIFELIDERLADGTRGDDVLSTLLEARHEDGSPMTAQELRDEAVTLIVAGHETTAAELAWAAERLARDRAVFQRLRDEVDSGDGDAYATATVQEVLRRRPVFHAPNPRLTMEEVEIGGWTYPPKVMLAVATYLVHHDPVIYPDPYAFRPERFLDEQPGTYTWLPFGGGRRRCLGATFAQLEMKIVLRALVAACDLQPAAETEMTGRRNIAITPRHGSRTVLAPRREPAARASGEAPREAAVH